MKTIHKNIFNWVIPIFLLIALCGTISCKKQLAAEYTNPDGFTNPSIEGLFSNLLQQDGLFRLNYGEWYHVWSEYFNPMLSTGGVDNTSGYPSINIQWDPYSDIYSKLRPIRDLNTFISQLPADEQAGYQPFILTSGIVKDFLFYNLTDDCGSVPYLEAMQAQNAVYAPKFDSQQVVYEGVLNDLKNISAKLKGYQLGTDPTSLAFKSYDILFNGDLSRWRIFTNSLRLRLALRLTNVEPDLAKSTISDVLTDGQYIQSAADDITIVDKDPTLTTNYANGGSIYRTFLEQRSVLFLPQKMLEVLRKTGFPDDPRLPVLFQPDKHGNYSAMPTEAADVAAINDSVTIQDVTHTFPSIYNRTTFETNVGMPQQIISSTEVHLIKAEAGIRWPDLGINSATEYQAAIQASIDYYYAINALNPGNNPGSSNLIPAAQPAKPSQTIIDAFLTAKVAEFNAASDLEKEGLISDQRFVHFNVMKEYELWSDNRRLFKELGTRVVRSPSNMKQMERFPYPASESQNNTNFSTVSSANNYTTPVWWTGR